MLLKDGRLITERELSREQNYYPGPAPVVGDEIIVEYEGRKFRAEVVWGNWPGRQRDADLVLIRVQEK